jgi:hypothetical protein
MPTIIDTVTSQGAMVDIRIGLSATQIQRLRAALRPIPQPITARALVDTGAEMTGVDSSLVQPLGLPARGSSMVNLPAHGGLNFSFLYDATVTIVHPSGIANQDLVVSSIAVLELPLAPLAFQVVIGRDLLARCRLLYNGLRNRFRLAY